MKLKKGTGARGIIMSTQAADVTQPELAHRSWILRRASSFARVFLLVEDFLGGINAEIFKRTNTFAERPIVFLADGHRTFR